MTRSPDASARPLLIGGMHRSGTSLTASLVASAGIDLGPELLGANASNPAGHFEDLGIQEFHCRALVARGICSEGYTATAQGDVPAALEPRADELLAERMRPGVAWGWKEPRTTLFLDFWQHRLPEARHLFVFRRPWEVADSLFRRGDQTFLDNPGFALDVWTHYNRLIVDFVRRHPERCVVVDIAQVIERPHRVFADVRGRLGIGLGRPARRYRRELFSRDVGRARAAIVRSVAPEAWQTYRELSALAGRADGIVAAPGHDPALGTLAMLEWARACRAEVEAQRLAREKREKHWRQFTDAVRGLPATLWAGLRSGTRRATPAQVVPPDANDIVPFPHDHGGADDARRVA